MSIKTYVFLSLKIEKSGYMFNYYSETCEDAILCNGQSFDEIKDYPWLIKLLESVGHTKIPDLNNIKLLCDDYEPGDIVGCDIQLNGASYSVLKREEI